MNPHRLDAVRGSQFAAGQIQHLFCVVWRVEADVVEADVPAVIVGFLRAVCAIANEVSAKGGMSVTYYRAFQPPPDLPTESPSEDRLMEFFFAEALVQFHALPDRQGYLVQELRRVVREATGQELVAARVAGFESDPHRALGLWWRSGNACDVAILRRSRD